MSKILVTGAAGFIGFHLVNNLLDEGYFILGVDNLNDYYDVNLKKARIEQLIQPNFTFQQVSIEDFTSMNKIFKDFQPDIVINLAAQAGVRYSLKNPRVYIQSNIIGFFNILELCKTYKVEHLIYASSSSVYGGNKKVPFSELDVVDFPVSLYAATKKSNELMAFTYSHLYKLPTTGLRFFTVYGPWGRPDMAYFQFTQNILNDKPIKVFNYGHMMRDFTYIDDIVEGINRIVKKGPKILKNVSGLNKELIKDIPYNVYNIGNNKPIGLMEFIHTLEDIIGKKAIIDFQPMQPGDVLETYADIDSINEDYGFIPKTTIKEGLQSFVQWYKDFYRKGCQ